MSATLDDPRIANGMRAQMELRRRMFANGETQIGWKVGFGAPAAQEKLKLTAPLVGYILGRAALASGTTVSLKGWQKPAAEAEIATYIGRDLPAGASRGEAKAAIAAIGPAIELADIDAPMDDVEAVLAGDIFQRHVVFGPRDATRHGARLDGLSAVVRKSGKDVPAPADLEANIGNIVDIVRHVADVAAAVSDGLRAGQFIITGSITAPMPIEPDDTGVDFALVPLGHISVTFSA